MSMDTESFQGQPPAFIDQNLFQAITTWLLCGIVFSATWLQITLLKGKGESTWGLMLAMMVISMLFVPRLLLSLHGVWKKIKSRGEAKLHRLELGEERLVWKHGQSQMEIPYSQIFDVRFQNSPRGALSVPQAAEVFLCLLPTEQMMSAHEMVVKVPPFFPQKKISEAIFRRIQPKAADETKFHVLMRNKRQWMFGGTGSRAQTQLVTMGHQELQFRDGAKVPYESIREMTLAQRQKWSLFYGSMVYRGLVLTLDPLSFKAIRAREKIIMQHSIDLPLEVLESWILYQKRRNQTTFKYSE